MKSEDSLGKLDLILEEIGQWGKYNVITYTLLLIPVLCSGMYASQFNFIAGDIDYRCKIPECDSVVNEDWIHWAIPYEDNTRSKCQRYDTIYESTNTTISSSNVSCTEAIFEKNYLISCDQIVYNSENTIVREFNLGCQEWKRTLVGSLHNAGLFVSIAITGLLSDKFGRKKCIVITSILNGLLGVLKSFSSNYIMFVILEFLEPALGGGLFTSCFILMIEVAIPKNRAKLTSMLNIVFSIGISIPAALSWVSHEWRLNLKIMYIPVIILFIYIWILDESTRWLLAKGKNADAIKILRKMAKFNNIIISDTLIANLVTNKEESKRNSIIDKETDVKTPVITESNIIKPKSKLSTILSSKIIMGRLVTCSFLWITCTFTYYGLSINSVSLSGNKYLNYILVSLIEIPSHLFGMFLVDIIGRKRTLISTFVLSGVCCILQAYIPQDISVASLILYLGGKFFITLAYVCFYVYVSEIFPTNMRQTLLSCCSSVGRIGSILAPQVPLMSNIMETLPALLFGGLALASGILTFTLPETTNIKLPDTIEEAENISTRRP